MNDFESMQNLLTRLEWIDLALKGSKGQAGLLDQLDTLLAEKAPDGSPGLIYRLEELISEAQSVMVAAASIQDALSDPVDLKFQRSIEQAVRSSIEKGAEGFDERVGTLKRVADQASEQMAQSVAQTEMVSRSAREIVTNTRSELERVTSQIAVQLEDMLKEVSDMLSPEALRKPLRDAALKAIQEVAAESSADQLLDLHRAELRKVAEEVKVDFRQYQEGFQEEMISIQQEASERVKKIVAGRAPSQAIVELYDQIDVLSAENESLKARIELEKGRSRHGQVATTVTAPKGMKPMVVGVYLLAIASVASVLFNLL